MMDMKNIGLFSGELDFDTRKFQDQLNAISMAAGALAHNLREIDATHATGETGTYTKTMVDPEKETNDWIKENDLVLICKAGDGRGESPELVGLYGRVIAVYNNDVVAVCVREDNEYFPTKEVKMYTKQLKVVVSS